MKICIIVDDYLPRSIKVAGKMMHELALEFLKLGLSVVVITPDDTILDPYTLENYQNVQVLRFRSGKIKNVWKPLRLWNELLLSYRAKKNLKQWIDLNPQDLVVYYSPTIFFSGLVEFLKKKWHCKSFLVLRDFFPQWTIDNGILKEGSLLVKFFRFFERKLYLAADRIGIQSPANMEWFDKNYPDFKNSILLFNWATDNIEKNLKKEIGTSFREKWKLNDKIIFFYGGNIGKAQYMENLIQLAEMMLGEEKAVFVFLGAGDEFDYVKEEIQNRNLTNSILLPSISQNEYISILEEVDIGCISLHPNHKTHNFPGKLLGYMQLGLPILGIVNEGNDVAQVINDANAGYIFFSSDTKLSGNQAKNLLSKKVREEMGKNSLKLLKSKFSVSKAANIILSNV